jgi:putative transcription factor|tara:strand:- start:10499 stop:10831 length:333 start_codon:yes stop_codon:yes gene_type:complete
MFDQDWKPVVLRNHELEKKNKQVPHYQHDKKQTIENETENLYHKKVGLSIGKQIEQARIAGGFKTRAELARSINEPEKTIKEYEAGKAIPETRVLQKLRNKLKVQLRVAK